jgi:hypothetical protein
MTETLACMPRSPEQLQAMVARLDPEHNYLPVDLDNADGDNNPATGQETRCNHFAADACLEMGVELPGQDKKKRVLARDQVLWLRDQRASKVAGWRPATEAEAIAAANKGQPVVIGWLNPNSRASSHIAIAVPSTDGLLWCAQAGRQCFNRGRVSQGFGFRVLEFYAHD